MLDDQIKVTGPSKCCLTHWISIISCDVQAEPSKVPESGLRFLHMYAALLQAL